MSFFFQGYANHRDLHSFPTRRLFRSITGFVSNIISFFGTFKIFWDGFVHLLAVAGLGFSYFFMLDWIYGMWQVRSEEHTSELQSLRHLVCRLLLEKKNTIHN